MLTRVLDEEEVLYWDSNCKEEEGYDQFRPVVAEFQMPYDMVFEAEFTSVVKVYCILAFILEVRLAGMVRPNDVINN